MCRKLVRPLLAAFTPPAPSHGIPTGFLSRAQSTSSSTPRSVRAEPFRDLSDIGCRLDAPSPSALVRVALSHVIRQLKTDPEMAIRELRSGMSTADRQSLVRALRMSGLVSTTGQSSFLASKEYSEKLFHLTDKKYGNSDGTLDVDEFHRALSMHTAHLDLDNVPNLDVGDVPYSSSTASTASNSTTSTSASTSMKDSPRIHSSSTEWTPSGTLHGQDVDVLDTPTSTGPQVTPPTTRQLVHLGVIHGLPFVGFGTLDNGIMIVAAEGIELTLSTALGVSTLGAAGLGNLLSDVAGITMADRIESMIERIPGLGKGPSLSTAQRDLPVVRYTRTIASMVGISVGCLLGMTPLIWM